MRVLERDLRAAIAALVETSDITPRARRELHRVLKLHRDRELEPSLQIANLKLRLDFWESHQHTTAGIQFLRDHFKIPA